MAFTAGETLTAGDLNNLPKMLARGRRETNSGTTTTEVGVLRIDDVPIAAGHLILIYTGSLTVDGNTNDNNIGARLRFTTDGSTPTTSSTQLQQGSYDQDIQTAAESGLIISASYTPAAAETLSVLLTVAAFVGAPTVQMLGSSTFPIELFIFDAGVDPGDSGVDI